MEDKKIHGGARPNSGLPRIEDGKKYFLVLCQMYEGYEPPSTNAGDR